MAGKQSHPGGLPRFEKDRFRPLPGTTIIVSVVAVRKGRWYLRRVYTFSL
ncbi:hypothetical protein [Eudoraea adriatica]|nr:hypothetical protein [Eudoraea adriatica]